MKTRRIIWFSACALSVIIFWSLIPVDIYDSNSIIYSFVGGVIFSATLFQALGDFRSLEDLNSKASHATDKSIPKERNLAPFVIFPGIVIVFAFVFHQSAKKEKELAANGILTKGEVTGGGITETTRRFKTTKSFDIKVAYRDSLKQWHWFDKSVSSSEFSDVYKGAKIDVVYSRKYPSLATAVFDIKELQKYTHVPDEKIDIHHLTAILEGEVKKDSILHYLNSINYEWKKAKEEGIYTNEKLKLIVKVFADAQEIAYALESNLLMGKDADNFEAQLAEHGFKKKASNVNGESKEIYYSEKYIVSKERKVSEKNSDDLFRLQSFTIYHILKKESSE
jgi:hypothetical protein